MYNKINLMLPTYKRSDGKLRTFIDTALETVSDPKNIVFTFCINSNDPETRLYLEEKGREIKARGSDIFVLTESLDRPHLGRYFNMMYRHHRKNLGKECLVSMLGDDMEFRSGAWDLRILQAANLFDGICIIYGDDQLREWDKMCVNLFTSIEMVDAQGGQFMCEDFEIEMIDLVWQQVAEQLGIHVYLDDVKIFHNHASRPGQMDATWKRMRLGFSSASSAWNKGGKSIVSKKVQCVLDRLPRIFQPDFDVIMTTYDRCDLLTQTIASYNASQRLPEKIHVFDDCSEELHFVRNAVATMKGAEFNEGKERLYGQRKTPAVLKDFFELRKSNGVLILDSDAEFSPLWFHRACVLARAFRKNREVAFWSLFNTLSQGHTVDELGDGLAPSKSIGAFGCYISLDSYKKYIKPYFVKDGKLFDWDNLMCRKAISDMREIFVCSPAFFQHTGYLDGIHSDGTMANPTVAYDFYCHNTPNDNEIYRKSKVGENLQDAERVLFSCPARQGDLIASSFIANAIVSLGFRVTFVAIQSTKKLAKHVCPRARIVTAKGVHKDADWGYSSTDVLKNDFPGHNYYINAQWGSPENHNTYMGSGKHPLDWLRLRVEKILDKKISNDYLSFANAANTKPVAVEWRTHKPRCIIAPEAKTSNAISPELLEQLRKKYEDDGYEVKILVKNRPEGLVWRAIRNTYIFRISIIQCIDVIKQCHLFVGNDSSLAWCSMFSRCEKHIYHKPDRLRIANTWFSDIDSRAKDFVVLDDGVTTRQATNSRNQRRSHAENKFSARSKEGRRAVQRDSRDCQEVQAENDIGDWKRERTRKHTSISRSRTGA